MFLLSVAGCQGMQEHTPAFISLAISQEISTSLKLEIPFPPLSKAQAWKAGSVGCGLVEHDMQEQPHTICGGSSKCCTVYLLQSQKNAPG